MKRKISHHWMCLIHLLYGKKPLGETMLRIGWILEGSSFDTLNPVALILQPSASESCLLAKKLECLLEEERTDSARRVYNLAWKPGLFALLTSLRSAIWEASLVGWLWGTLYTGFGFMFWGLFELIVSLGVNMFSFSGSSTIYGLSFMEILTRFCRLCGMF